MPASMLVPWWAGVHGRTSECWLQEDIAGQGGSMQHHRILDGLSISTLNKASDTQGVSDRGQVDSAEGLHVCCESLALQQPAVLVAEM